MIAQFEDWKKPADKSASIFTNGKLKEDESTVKKVGES